jgi:NAD(P)-dependent dehydrogenase (short-subunit alcohol dehydrogenase family)
MNDRLAGKITLVTGAGSGIGRASALAFAREGARVIVADVDIEGGEETLAQLRQAGSNGLFVRTDVTDASSVAAMITETVAAYGRLDCAHNNAGIEGPQVPLHEYPVEAWDRVLAVNLTGVWLCMQHEIGQMLRQGGGAIVNTASIQGLIGAVSGICAYNASKHAVVGLTKTAALEYAKQRIRVNAVCPGFTETPMIERLEGGDPVLAAQMAAMVPVGRYATAAEIAEAVVWLCSDAASFVTGVAIPIDGGYIAK